MSGDQRQHIAPSSNISYRLCYGVAVAIQSLPHWQEALGAASPRVVLLTATLGAPHPQILVPSQRQRPLGGGRGY